jgi:N-sulfoglucosamine sulfohydrolase
MKSFCQLLLACVIVVGSMTATSNAVLAEELNVVLITVDDMNWDSVGTYGCPIENITPNIDKLAKEGVRFNHGHVTIAICQPTRAVWMTGRYPHNSGALGFDPIKPKVPTLVEKLRKSGYYTGILAKTGHVVPTRAAAWNERIAAKHLRNGREPKLFYKYSQQIVSAAKKNGQPFFLMANAQDPHRPFVGSKQELNSKKNDKKSKNHQYGGGFPDARRIYKPSEIVVPKFLPDIPDVRKELAEYFTSVHRADEVVGAVLKAIDDAGVRDNTLVMFMSDHGMPLPFAKTNVWKNSTKTPWIVRWPKVVKPGTVDSTHFVTGIDLCPTILDALGLDKLEGTDGASFVDVLKGQSAKRRTHAFTHINRIASRKAYPMRSLQDKQFGYIYNDWSDGKTVFKNESQSGLTFKAMQAAAKEDKQIAARVKHFVFRTKEELYDYQTDPDALHNLAADPKYATKLQEMRELMAGYMVSCNDPLRINFDEFRAAVK